MSLYTLERSQKIPATIEKIWDFISSPVNLKEITPEDMGFEVTTKNLPGKIYPGMIISYKVRPLWGLKMIWVTSITQVKEKEFFVDEQQLGPYKFWHHQHHIRNIEGGVLMTDIVNYSPPFGFIGRIANSLFIQKRLNEIFEFRSRKMEALFGKFHDS